MGLQFQSPGFKPIEYAQLQPGTSLESIFNMYQRRKQVADADQLASTQATLQHGFDPRTLPAQALRQGMGAAPGAPTNPNVPEGAFGDGSPALQAPAEHPMAAAVRTYREKLAAAEGMATQTQQATLEHTQADTKYKEAEAYSKLHPPASSNHSFNSLATEEQGTITSALLSGRLTAEDVNKRGADLPALVASLRADPNWRASTGIAERAGEKATKTFEGGEGAQKPARLMKSLIPSLDYLQKISADANNDSWKVINKYGIKLAAERGDSKAQEMLDASSAISDEFQAMIGGGSNAKLELGMHLFESAKTPEQIARSVNFIKQNLNNRSEALTGKEKGSPIKTLEQTRATEGGGPAIGTVKAGYRFTGGNPADKASWVKQ